MQKKQYYKQWLGRAFTKPITITSIISLIATIVFGIISSQFPHWHDFFNILSWALPLTVLTATTIWGLALAPYKIHTSLNKEKTTEITQLKTKLEEIISEIPNIKLSDWKNVEGTLKQVIYDEPTTMSGVAPIVYGGTAVPTHQAQDYTGHTTIFKPYFTHLLIANDPEKKIGTDAKKVRTKIGFYDEKRENLIFPEIEGRWSLTEEYAIKGLAAEYETEIDIPANGNHRPLDIVLKYDEDNACYACNNETPTRAPSDWRDSTRKEEFWFKLKNNGKDTQVELEFDRP